MNFVTPGLKNRANPREIGPANDYIPRRSNFDKNENCSDPEKKNLKGTIPRN